MIILEDISERIRAQQTVQEYAERLKALSRHLLQAQEEERRRIARELHDQVGQSLTLLQVKLQAARDQPGPGRIGSALQESISLVEGFSRKSAASAWTCVLPCWRIWVWCQPSGGMWTASPRRPGLKSNLKHQPTVRSEDGHLRSRLPVSGLPRKR